MSTSSIILLGVLLGFGIKFLSDYLVERIANSIIKDTLKIAIDEIDNIKDMNANSDDYNKALEDVKKLLTYK